MFRRRGCMFGIGGIVVALLLCCAVGYYVALPRFAEQVERELTGVLSTEVAGVLDREIELAPVGAGEYRIPLDELEREVAGGSANLEIEGVTIRQEGDDLVVGFAVPNAETSYRFTPQVSPEGYLQMANMRGDGGIVEKILAPEAIGNAVENAVNAYLQANGLYLDDVTLAGDELVLVIGDR